MENKTIIFGAASKSVGRQLIEWVVSLRSLGKYQDSIMVLDYGVTDVIKRYCEALGVKFIPCILRKENIIGNSRYIDLISILTSYPDHYIAIFDVDIWFQSDIRGIWEIIKSTEGCFLSCEKIPLSSLHERTYRGPEGGTFRDEVLDKYIRLIDKFGGTINAGLLAGKTKPLITKLIGFRKALANMVIVGDWGAEQFYLNYSFDFKKDRGDGVQWNCLIRDCELKDNYYYYVDHEISIKLCGIHCFKYKLEDRSNHMFSRHHSKIFSAVLGEVRKKYDITEAGSRNNSSETGVKEVPSKIDA